MLNRHLTTWQLELWHGFSLRLLRVFVSTLDPQTWVRFWIINSFMVRCPRRSLPLTPENTNKILITFINCVESRPGTAAVWLLDFSKSLMLMRPDDSESDDTGSNKIFLCPAVNRVTCRSRLLELLLSESVLGFFMRPLPSVHNTFRVQCSTELFQLLPVAYLSFRLHSLLNLDGNLEMARSQCYYWLTSLSQQIPMWGRER